MEKTKILLVEDSLDDAKLLQLILRECRSVQFDIEHVRFLKDALEKIKSGSFAGILLDLSLPDSRGFETFLKIREVASDLPILILTGNDDEEIAVNAVREGAQDYVVKGTLDSNLLGRAISYAIERKKSEERIRKALQEREVMLREIHHRVRNNLQVVCSLLSQQGRKVVDESARFIFNESRNRILSMALVHEELYRSRDFTHVDFGRYLDSVSSTLAAFYGVERTKVHTQGGKENVLIPIDMAVPCGLIVNELLSNAFKHGRAGLEEKARSDLEVWVHLERGADRVISLSVEDTGPGLPEALNIEDAKSLGFEVISILLHQINGRLQYSKNGKTKFTVEFADLPAQNDSSTPDSLPEQAK